MNRTYIYHVIQADVNDGELNIAHITSQLYAVPWVKVSQHKMSNIPLQKSVYEFLNLSNGGQGSVFINFLLRHYYSEWSEEWKSHFARMHLARKWHIKNGKINQVLRLACFFEVQKLIGCGTTTRKCWLLTDSLSSPAYRHIGRKMTILFHLHFWHNDFIIDMIA